jgi:hypothetical protein
MNFTTLVAAALLALSGTSYAAPGPIDLSTGSAGFSNTPVAGDFTDVYTFTLVSPAVLNGSVTAVVNGAQDVDFTSIVLSGPSGSFNFLPQLGDPVEVLATPAAGFQLASGFYALTLTGSNSLAMGSYGGNIAVTAVPAVPEPETYALMLGGLGALAFMARRQKRVS